MHYDALYVYVCICMDVYVFICVYTANVCWKENEIRIEIAILD